MEFCRRQVESDCEELLTCFHNSQSVRFQLFSDMWRERNFSHIFYGTIKHEKRVFSRLVLDTASKFFLPPFSFQIRVGGLYLLYGLYQCQTASPPEQIRVALKDWEDVKKFEKDAVDAKHFDIVYILRRLESCKAFVFTATPTLLTYQVKKKKAPRLALCDDFMARASGPQELISMELLEELSNVHELYEKLKKSAGSSAAALADPSVHLIREDLVPQLRGAVVEFHTWQQRKDDVEDKDSGEGPSSQQEGSRRADLIAAIKSKAYGEAAEATRSRRHRQVEVEFSSSESRPGPPAVRSKVTKQSLKARTTENLGVSEGSSTGEAWEEAVAPTQISCLTLLDSHKKPKEYKRFRWS